jgi:Protein of unknown function (DUF4231)
MSEPDVVIDRLEDQIKWYDNQSASAKRMFKRLKTATLAISVSIPLSAAFATRYPLQTGVITGVMGASIALLEGLQQLNQYHQNWITFRSTAEALKHEKFLFFATAGPYTAASNPKSLLAERIESLVSQENTKWASAQEQTPKTDKSGTH